MGGKRIDYSGKRIGRVEIGSLLPSNSSGSRVYSCRCDCGKEFTFAAWRIRKATENYACIDCSGGNRKGGRRKKAKVADRWECHLSELRNGKEISSHAAAVAIGIGHKYYASIEACECMPSAEVAYAICEFFKCRIQDIWVRKIQISPNPSPP